MAGDIKEEYTASSALAVTNLHSLASSSDWTAGWGSASIANTSALDEDILLAVTLTTASANRQAGQINVYLIPALNDTPTYPAVASGTLGTEGAIAFADTEERDAWCIPFASFVVDTSNGSIVGRGQTAVAELFGGRLPTHFVVFIAQNATTTTTAGLAASGNAVYATPIKSQYT